MFSRSASLKLGVVVIALAALVGCASSPPSAPAPPPAPKAAAAPTQAPQQPAAPAAKPTAAPAAAAPVPSGQSVKLRLSFIFTGEGPWARSMAAFADAVAKGTNNRITIDLFPGGSLGSEPITGVQTGAIDIGMASNYTKEIPLGTVNGLPYLFRDESHFVKAVDGQLGEAVSAAALKGGLRILAWEVGGWRDVYSTKPIRSLGDLKGMKVRVMQVPTYVEVFKAFGAIPLPLAWADTYLALRQGTVDGSETALSAMEDAKHFEVSKYATLTHHALSDLPIIISEKRWQSFSKADQDVIAKAAKDAAAMQRDASAKEDASLLNRLKGNGVEIIAPDQAQFREAARPVIDKLVTDQQTKDLVKLVQAIK